MEGFTVNIIISRQLYKYYNFAYLNRFRPVVKTFLFWECVVFICIGFYGLLQQQEGELNSSIWALFVIPAVLVALRWFTWYKAGHTYDTNAKLQKPIEYIVTPEHIKTRGENFETTYPWTEVVKIKKTDKFVAVFVTKVASLLFPIDQVSEEELAFIEEQFRKVKK